MPLIKDIKELYQPTKRQLKGHRSKAEFLLIGGAVRGGKTVFLVNEALYYSLHYKCNVFLCRKYKTATKKNLLPVIKEYLSKKFIKSFNSEDLIFEFVNGSKLYLFGVRDHEAMKRIMGLEAAFIGIDEGSHIDDTGETFRDLTTRLSQSISGKLKFVITSNPCRGWIRELFIDERKRGFEFIQFLPKHNPYLEKNYIKRQEKVLTPQEFEVKILGKWDKAQVEEAMFPYDLVEEGFKKKRQIEGDICYGIDSALGRDESVVVKRSGNKFKFILIEKTKDLRELANKISEYISNKNAKIYCDSVGYGSGVIALLKDRGFINIEGVNQSEAAIDNTRFFNKRAENYQSFKEQIEGYILPEDKKLKEELLSLKQERDNLDRLKIESKAKLSKKGKSPSRLDACILAALEGTREDENNESEIIISKSQFYQLTKSLNYLEKVMLDYEKNKDINFLEKNEKKFIGAGVIGTEWKKYRGEYDRLIKLWNRVTNKGWSRLNIWMLKTRGMIEFFENPVHLEYSKEDNESINVGLKLEA